MTGNERLTSALSDRYRIERELGQGGMATVYLAEDLKHKRKVALKVLKPELAAVLGAERFVQEITTTASLQHPHILPLFDSGTVEGFLYYVMPFIQGETVRDKLNRETQLGVDEAVKIAAEVADALQYAHEQGVIHRDIKPENILLANGRPMVADFGIALAVSAAAGGRMTETGLSLGTPHYMSPEQATAEKEITGRSDIYSLASVLYEMLAGVPPHEGGSAQQTIMRIITDVPRPVTELRKAVPPNVAAALAKALEKLPADRFESARAFADALQSPVFRHGDAEGPRVLANDGRWRRLAIGMAMVAGVTTALAIAGLVRRSPTSARQVGEIRFPFLLDADSGVFVGGAAETNLGWPASTALALSPDGTLLVYAGWKTEPDAGVTSQLYRRPLGQERADAIPGTEGAFRPFFSPSGKWIAFFSGRSLKRVPLGGGDVETIALESLMGGMLEGASWGDNDEIIYAVRTTRSTLYRVPAGGGQPERLTVGKGPAVGLFEKPVGLLRNPELLPGGRALLLEHFKPWDPRNAKIIAVDLATGDTATLLTDAMDPRYVAPGRLLFMRRGTLMEVAFDQRRLRLDGQSRVLLQNVMQAVEMIGGAFETGAAQVAVSRLGDLAYVDGGTFPEPQWTVLRVATDGRATSLGWEKRRYSRLRISPQGDRVAYLSGPGINLGLFVRDIARGDTRRLNTGSYANQGLIWSPDGRFVAYSMARDSGGHTMYRIPADGDGKPELLVDRGYAASWSSGGVLAFFRGRGIWTMAPGGQPSEFGSFADTVAFLEFSPDGRWLAYASTESGRFEVHVRPYPGPGAAIPVSSGGGDSPAWSPDGRRIFYLRGRTDAEPTMMVADVTSSDPFRVSRPQVLISPWPYVSGHPTRNFDVFRDGSFLAASQGDTLNRQRHRVSEIHVLLNFLGISGKTR